MIGVDTNVLLRFALDDDADPSKAATDVLQAEGRADDPALICPFVLMEFVWTLRRKPGGRAERTWRTT